MRTKKTKAQAVEELKELWWLVRYDAMLCRVLASVFFVEPLKELGKTVWTAIGPEHGGSVD